MPFLLPDPPPSASRKHRKKVVCAGRLSPSKGQDVLLRAIPLIRESVPDVVVEFVGDGPMRGEYEDMARSLGVQDACEFTGAVPLEEVYEKMSSASLVAAPSLSEAFGLVTIEAQSVGTPVVASDIDGIRETIVHERTGFLVPPGDSVSLAEKIVLLLENESLRSEFGKASRARFESDYSNRNISRHADFFERLARG